MMVLFQFYSIFSYIVFFLVGELTRNFLQPNY
jgi:hypothetical protein